MPLDDSSDISPFARVVFDAPNTSSRRDELICFLMFVLLVRNANPELGAES